MALPPARELPCRLSEPLDIQKQLPPRNFSYETTIFRNFSCEQEIVVTEAGPVHISVTEAEKRLPEPSFSMFKIS